MGRGRLLLRVLGPGLIAGASDTDPTTVAALTVIGATTGYGLLWLVLWHTFAPRLEMGS